MPKDASATTTLRTINQLVKDVEVIYVDCGQGNGKKKKEKQLDNFQQTKKDLSELITSIKQDVKIQQNMVARQGQQSGESVKLKQKINININEAKRLHEKLEEEYKQDEDRVNNNKKDAIDREQLTEREELVKLLKQDLDYTENDFKPKQEQSRGFQIASKAREKRRQKRDQGMMSNDPQPLSPAQQQFIQESIQRDAVLDEKLDIIKKGVQQLGVIAGDLNEEFDKQNAMLDELDTKMDDITEKLKARNKQMKDILEKTGGAQRWCPIIMLFIILLGLGGWIYQIATN